MKKIPNIFKPEINKRLDNNKKTYYSYLEANIKEENNNQIKNSFRINKLNNNNYIFNSKVLIKTKNNTLETRIASKMGNNIITYDGTIIPIREIISIDEI